MGNITSGTVEQPINATETSVKTESAGLQAPGNDEPQNPGTGEVTEQGSPKGRTDDGQSEGGEVRQKRSKVLVDRDEVLGLRSERRQMRNEIADMKAMLQQLKTGNQGRGVGEQPDGRSAGTEQDFWTDPNASLASLRNEIRQMRDFVSQKMDSVREQDAQVSQLHQERSEAVKLIHSQPGWDTADDQELIDIIEEKGLGVLPPLAGAEAALGIWKLRNGVRDTSQIRARATSIVGAPPAAGGVKIWPKVEVERILDRAIAEAGKPNPTVSDAMIAEIKLAQAEGRIR